MNDITEEKREAAYQSAPEHIHEMYSSPETGTILLEVFGKTNLPKDSYRDFALLIGDIILGLYQKSELRTLLESELEISEEVAQKIEADLKPLLSKLDGAPSIPPAETNYKEKLELRPEGVPLVKEDPETQKTEEVAQTPEPTLKNVSDAKPLTREAVLSALSPKRTMANDIATLAQEGEKVTGYEAYVAQKEQTKE